MKSLLRAVILLALIILGWYLAADRMTPFTGNARVKAVITPIVPQVSGSVVASLAENGVLVEPGDILARIDSRAYEIDKARAEAELEAAAQDLGASSAEVAAARAALSRSEAELENMRLQTGRIFELERKGLVPAARGDDARASLTEAEAAVSGAEAELRRAEQALGTEGRDNPRIQRELAALADAELNLEWTVLRAPSRGAVTDLNISEGAYAQAGVPLMTFIDSGDVWIEAYMTENNLSRMRVGQPVDVVLDVHPGRILKGEVASFSGAASVGSRAQPGALASAPRASGWMREPQRFPVRIVLPGFDAGDPDDDVILQLNGQADVVVYTSGNRFMNALARAYIRILSYVSYAY